MVVSEDGQSLAFGWNKHGQLGSGSVKNGKFNFVSSYLSSNSLMVSACICRSQ